MHSIYCAHVCLLQCICMHEMSIVYNKICSNLALLAANTILSIGIINYSDKNNEPVFAS